MEFKDDEIKRLQLATETEEKKRFLHNFANLDKVPSENTEDKPAEPLSPVEPTSSLRQIRTFQGDVATALENQQESLVSIQKRQSDKNAALQNQARPEKTSHGSKTVALVLGIILLITLGGVGGYFGYREFEEKTALPVIAIVENRFLPVREEGNINALDLNRETLINLVRETSGKQVEAGERGEIIHLNLRKGEGETAPLLTTSEFIVLNEASPSSALVRAFDPLFMLGILAKDTSRPFILIKLDSFEQAYPGMLDWEKSLRDDLLPLFLREAEFINIPSDKAFEDVTLANKDARVLRDSNQKTVLLYTFVDNQMLLITDSEGSMRTMLSLISAEKLTR